MTDEQSWTRMSQRGMNHAAPPPQQPIKHRPQQQTTAAYDADTLQEDEREEERQAAALLFPARTPRSSLNYQRLTRDQPRTAPPGSLAHGSQTRHRPRTEEAAEEDLDTRPTQRDTRLALPPRRRRGRWRWHPLLFVGLGLFIMVMGYLLFGAVSSWWQTTVDGWRYGYPRTYQTDAVVGHHDSPANPSHFIAINLHSHIEVIEFPGGDVTHARVYLGPTLIGAGSDLAPVTLAFKDVNGDGKPDLIVSVGGTIVVFINDGGQFRPLKPGEQVTL
jgi:hypothetical protein